MLVQTSPDLALDLKDRMLDYALKNRLLGEFEAIYALFGVALINIPRAGAYDLLKTEMQATVNRLKIEAGQLEQVGKVEEELRAYLRLGEIYARYGDHQESEYYYSRILRKQSTAAVVRDEEYLWQWGREMFYLVDSLEERGEQQARGYKDLEFFSVRLFPDRKSINAALAFVRDLYKLSRKGRARSKVKVLENILDGNFSIQELLAAKIFNLADLGLLYSVLALAFKDRSALKRDVKWSSKIEISYLRADYARLLLDLRKAYESYGQFSLPLRLVYDECLLEIKKRIFCEIFNAYQAVPVAKVEAMTGLRAAEVESWVRQNTDLPYLWDPVTQSVVYYEKTVPLYLEAMTFYRLVREKYEEKERMLANETKEDVDVDLMMRMMGREGMKRSHFH